MNKLNKNIVILGLLLSGVAWSPSDVSPEVISRIKQRFEPQFAEEEMRSNMEDILRFFINIDLRKDEIKNALVELRTPGTEDGKRELIDEFMALSEIKVSDLRKHCTMIFREVFAGAYLRASLMREKIRSSVIDPENLMEASFTQFMDEFLPNLLKHGDSLSLNRLMQDKLSYLDSASEARCNHEDVKKVHNTFREILEFGKISDSKVKLGKESIAKITGTARVMLEKLINLEFLRNKYAHENNLIKATLEAQAALYKAKYPEMKPIVISEIHGELPSIKPKIDFPVPADDKMALDGSEPSSETVELPESEAPKEDDVRISLKGSVTPTTPESDEPEREFPESDESIVPDSEIPDIEAEPSVQEKSVAKKLLGVRKKMHQRLARNPHRAKHRQIQSTITPTVAEPEPLVEFVPNKRRRIGTHVPEAIMDLSIEVPAVMEIGDHASLSEITAEIIADVHEETHPDRVKSEIAIQNLDENKNIDRSPGSLPVINRVLFWVFDVLQAPAISQKTTLPQAATMCFTHIMSYVFGLDLKTQK